MAMNENPMLSPRRMMICLARHDRRCKKASTIILRTGGSSSPLRSCKSVGTVAKAAADIVLTRRSELSDQRLNFIRALQLFLANRPAGYETGRGRRAVSRRSDKRDNSSSHLKRNECAESSRHNGDTEVCNGRERPFLCERRLLLPENLLRLLRANAQPIESA